MENNRICEECGQGFYVKYDSIKRKYCSRVCYGTATSRKILTGERTQPKKKRRGETIPCEVCGKPVYRNKSQAKEGKRYCSHKCADIAATKEPVIKQCVTCGKTLTLKPSQAHINSCSMDCRDAAATKRPLDRMHNGKRARLDRHGYVMVYEPSHPNKSFHGWQYEHRLVVEKELGRHLASDEHVHHINAVRDDNRPENLQAMDANDHAAVSSQDYRDSINQQLAELAQLRIENEAYKRRFGPL